MRELRTRLDDLIEGRASRLETAGWAIEHHDTPGLFGDAAAVLLSLSNADESEHGEPLLRSADFHAYRRWLLEGEGFYGDELPLAVVRCALEELDRVHATPAVRFWSSGLGWCWQRRFISTATGRPFVAFSMSPDGPVAIHKRREDEALEALADLLEEFSLSPAQMQFVQDGVSLSQACALAGI